MDVAKPGTVNVVPGPIFTVPDTGEVTIGGKKYKFTCAECRRVTFTHPFSMSIIDIDITSYGEKAKEAILIYAGAIQKLLGGIKVPETRIQFGVGKGYGTYRATVCAHSDKAAVDRTSQQWEATSLGKGAPQAGVADIEPQQTPQDKPYQLPSTGFPG